MAVVMTYTRSDLARDLQALGERAVRTEDELDGWYSQAKEVYDKLMADASVTLGMSDFVWHYLSDADVRFKDPRYAKLQNERLAEVIAELKAPAYIEWHDSTLDEWTWLPDGSAKLVLSSLPVYVEKGKEHYSVCAWRAVLVLEHAELQAGLRTFSPGEWVSDGAIIGPDGSELELVSVLKPRECTAVRITFTTGEVLKVKAGRVRLELVSAGKSLRDWYGPLRAS
jgi:hypothetical protein